MAPPNNGWGWQTIAAARGVVSSGASSRASSLPAGPSSRWVSMRRGIGFTGGSRLVRSGVLPQPGGVTGFIERVVGERQHGGDHFGLLGQDGVAVFVEEDEAGEEGGALVAVDESVVLAQAGGVCGGQIAQIRLPVDKQVSRSGQRRLDGAWVADSGRASEFHEAFAVKARDGCRVHPDRFRQRANSRMAGA